MANIVNAKKYLTKDEISLLMKKSDWKALWEVFQTWAWIAMAFLLAGLFPNPLTIVIVLFILGGKQLALAIIMHDASHRALFKSRAINDFVGNWLGGYPILQDCDRYRDYHLKHHVVTGLDDDPDLNLTVGYPAGKGSMLRKLARDLFGLTGIKANFGVLLMHFGFLEYTLGGVVVKIDQNGRALRNILKTGFKNLKGPVIMNLFLFGILWLTGAPWLYLLWVGAMLTTFQFSLRIRSIAEHSIVPDQKDPLKNTRTTYANFFERILFAPHHVNYHAEHHLLMTVPPYNLPKLHKLVQQRGFFKEGLLAKNYWEVFRLATAGK